MVWQEEGAAGICTSRQNSQKVEIGIMGRRESRQQSGTGSARRSQPEIPERPSLEGRGAEVVVGTTVVVVVDGRTRFKPSASRDKPPRT